MSTAALQRENARARTVSSAREQLRPRTRAFALRIVKVAESLPHTRAGNHFGNQLLRCGKSVGANYRAACRARSPAEFCSKLGIVEEEADASVFWLEILVDTRLVSKQQLQPLIDEANELIAMVVSSIKTARRSK
jgi:four helix bundle protein